MSENVVVIASVLKPVDDTRLFEKLGLTIRESKKYRVNIIGFEAKNPAIGAGVVFHPLYSGSRLGLGRLLVPWKFMRKLIKLRPNLLIVCTPELLVPAVVYKLFSGIKLWYDVQENYRINVAYQSSYAPLFKPLLRLIIWSTETFSQPFINHYLLAEEGYAKELSFTDGKSTVLENKFSSIRLSSTNTTIADSSISLIFTGTCSRENGIIEAISLIESLLAHDLEVSLRIIGHIPDSKVHQYIESKVAKYHGKYIRLLSDGSLVSHEQIMQEAARSDFGLVSHQVNPSNQNCVPTKIYEYLGLRIPMILQRHPLWESKVSSYPGAVVIDYCNFDPQILWHQINTVKFYQTIPGSEISWKQEALKLQGLLCTLDP